MLLLAQEMQQINSRGFTGRVDLRVPSVPLSSVGCSACKCCRRSRRVPSSAPFWGGSTTIVSNIRGGGDGGGGVSVTGDCGADCTAGVSGGDTLDSFGESGRRSTTSLSSTTGGLTVVFMTI